MAIKVDGTNSQIKFLAGTGNTTTLTSNPTSVPWTMTLPPNAGGPGDILITDGNGNLTWGNGAGDVDITDDTTTAADLFPMFSNIVSGTASTAYVSSTKYTYNPASGQLSAPNVESTEGIHLNAQVITQSYTIPAGMNGLSAGPVSAPAGIVVTVNPGQTWVVA